MRKKPRILIVEDNVHNHELYRRAFEEKGFEVVIKKDAEEFFSDIVSEIKPDIISMDLMIEKDDDLQHDGFWAIGELKRDLRTHDIPVIVLSSFFEGGKAEQAKELGAVDFISNVGEAMSGIPGHYLQYLKNPKHYVPMHPAFQKSAL